MKTTFSRLSLVAEGLTAPIERHENNEFTQVEELFESWKGDDADSCFEHFGSRLRGASGLQRRMLTDLLGAVGEDASAQAMAVCMAYNTLIGAHETLAELQDRSFEDAAMSKLTGSLLVGRVPYLGDAVALADYIIEIGSDGASVGQASGWLSRFISSIQPDIQSPPPPNIDQEIGEWLRCAAPAYKQALVKKRDEVNHALSQSLADWSAQDMCSIAPGTKD